MPRADPPATLGADPNAVKDLLLALLRRSHLSAPSDLAAVVSEEAARIGATHVAIYLADYEQDVLVPLSKDGSSLSVAGTVAGRVYSSSSILVTSDERADGQRLWLPLLDGTERLGVMGMSLPGDDVCGELVSACERLAHLVALLVVTKSAYGDTIERVRRCKPISTFSKTDILSNTLVR